MRALIRQIHAQWETVKEQRRMRAEAAGKVDAARALAACNMFRGDEDLPELARIMLTPQGLEFCLANNFPNLSTLRLLKDQGLEKYGIYIDAGDITVKDRNRVLCVGRTYATVHCSLGIGYHVAAMHGASATVIASGWSVVRTECGVSSNITRRVTENAVIL